MRLVLASASPARLDTLRRAHFDPVVVVSDVDEDAILATHPPGTEAIEQKLTALARAKADAVAQRILAGQVPQIGAQEDAVVIGCDSMFELDGELHGKPHDPDHARRRLHTMSGKTGILHTGHAIIRLPGRTIATETVATEVHMSTLTDTEIEAYLATAEPLNVAGSFTIDGFGGPFIAGVTGDHHNVIGISLPAVRRLLATLGVSVTSLWA